MQENGKYKKLHSVLLSKTFHNTADALYNASLFVNILRTKYLSLYYFYVKSDALYNASAETIFFFMFQYNA